MLIFSREYTPWECGLGHSILSAKAHITSAEWIKWGVWTCGWKNIPVLILIFSWCLTGINYHFNMVSAGLHPTTALQHVFKQFSDEDTAFISLTILNSFHKCFACCNKTVDIGLNQFRKKSFVSKYKTYNHFNMTNCGERRDKRETLSGMGRQSEREGCGSLLLNTQTFCVLWIFYIVWNPNPAQVMADVLVTLKETFRSELKMGFLLTHRQSVHRAQSLQVNLPLLLCRVSQASRSLGLHCFTSLDACEYLQPCSTVQGTHLWSLAFTSKEWII